MVERHRRDRGSKPPQPFRSLDNFVYPSLSRCVSEEIVKAVAVGPFYLVSMPGPGEVKYSTQGNGKHL